MPLFPKNKKDNVDKSPSSPDIYPTLFLWGTRRNGGLFHEKFDNFLAQNRKKES